jgi:transcriptional regulator with XRE-family HTH domain
VLGPRVAPISLRAERLNRGLSVAEAAEQMDVGGMTLSRAEQGSHTPRPGAAFRIASFYGYQVTDIWPVEADPTADLAAEPLGRGEAA